MVLIPQQAEQQMHAQRVADLDLGIMLDKGRVTASALREAVECVANTPTYERALQMQQLTREAGGYQLATTAIVQFTDMHGKRTRD